VHLHTGARGPLQHRLKLIVEVLAEQHARVEYVIVDLLAIYAQF
jgi:hypothetical protein